MDLNCDGIKDVAIGGGNTELSILLGVVIGTFVRDRGCAGAGKQRKAELRIVQRNYQVDVAVDDEISCDYRLRLYSDGEIGFRTERSIAISQHDGHRIRASTG